MQVDINQALELILKNTKTKTTKIIPIEEALGYVLAKGIIATHALPAYDNSAMDGYAIKFEDKEAELKISGSIFAGDDFNKELKSGECFSIMTGAKVPKGADTIVPKEDTTITKKGYLKITKAPSFDGSHIRRYGEDIAKDEVILNPKTRLYAHHITLLASQGISHIEVYKKPRIAIFASGNELKMHYEKVEPYQFYNSNSPTFYARAKELGCEVDFIGTAKDSLEDLKLHIKSALHSDLIITSGGVSVGDADFTKEAFSGFNFEIFFDKIAIKPGKPTMFGRIDETLVLNLPGNPLAAMLNFEIFAKSIILALSGDEACYLGVIEAKASQDIYLHSPRTTVISGYFDGSTFTPSTKSSPGMIMPLALANSFIIIDEHSNSIKSGEVVKVLPTRFDFNSKTEVDILTHS